MKQKKPLIDWLREDRRPAYLFSERNLPDPSKIQCPTIVMTREKVVEFRNNYTAILAFAAVVTGQDIKAVCAFDLIKWLCEQEVMP